MASTDDYTIAAKEAGLIDAPELAYRPSVVEKKMKLGLIGCGGITEQHMKGYEQGGYEVVAFADLKHENAVVRRDTYNPQGEVYATHHELLADEEVEIVDIATHPAERETLIMDAIKAGKHVLSQKPFVLDLGVGEKLAALAEEKRVKLAVNQNGRWAPHVSYMRKAIEAGLIGDVTSISMNVAWDHNWVVGTAFNEMPHLVLYDFAIHWFDMVNCYMGDREAKRVYGRVCECYGQEAKPPLGATAIVEYEGAQVTMLFDGNAKFGARDTTLIIGTKGALRSEGPGLGEQIVTLITEDGEARPELEGTWFPDGFNGAVSELMLAVEEEREPTHGARDNLKSLAMAFAAIESSEKGEAVKVGDARKIRPEWLKY
ncbi:1,5-anhydro-D-fructose reductase [Poriferisphaera corsica]|uniref:1,5-anhydro-D-fructose reductase n=1 Tax=Poriferisphaera corsica TaxID=2528020 RepID=A0A517YUJ3_9BACT|nr:Gfo/Idh/MocA family oxidoreductase [Poriferisphaera corsica]QDU33888.1 1,5-anhydro-D-fructose reductase [Poriferisphaera corsica]